jgi:hypothetical protein
VIRGVGSIDTTTSKVKVINYSTKIHLSRYQNWMKYLKSI